MLQVMCSLNGVLYRIGTFFGHLCDVFYVLGYFAGGGALLADRIRNTVDHIRDTHRARADIVN